MLVGVVGLHILSPRNLGYTSYHLFYQILVDISPEL